MAQLYAAFIKALDRLLILVIGVLHFLLAPFFGLIAKVLDMLEHFLERRALRQSMIAPVIRLHQRDNFKWYENGRWTIIRGELMSRGPRLIYSDYPLTWNDSGESLSPDKRQEVLQQLGAYLDKNKISWKFA